MKKIILTIAIVLGGLGVFAQPTPPTGSTGHTGAGQNGPIGGGAPIDGGLSILLLMSVAYGAKRTIQIIKKDSQN